MRGAIQVKSIMRFNDRLKHMLFENCTTMSMETPLKTNTKSILLHYNRILQTTKFRLSCNNP